MKDHEIDPKAPGPENPYRALLHKLTGVTLKKPRARAPANIWRRTQRDDIEAEVRQRLQVAATESGELMSPAQHKKMAPMREKVAKDLYGVLGTEEKEYWTKLASEEHEAAVAKWTEAITACPSRLPDDRQKYVSIFSYFLALGLI